MLPLKELVVVCLSVISLCHTTRASKLNMPKVLLPLARGTRINFTLETTEGCYKWTSTRPEVASVQPLNEEIGRACSRRAVLQALSTQPSRLTSIILAEDVVTGQVLRCDAIVDVISDIQIVSTTRELHLEDSPLALEIHALDSEGNTFSTLAGLMFDWTLVKDVNGFSDSYNALRVLKFSESTYTPPGYISEMERVGKQGNIILVSGLKTGHAKVKAKIQEPLYQDVHAAEVKLLILENILLSPAYDVYLLAGTSIRYQVLKIRQGSITELSMPCDQYELHLQNSVVDPSGNPDIAVAGLNQRTSTVTAFQLGHINVVLDHKSLRMQGVFRLPNSTLFVVDPGYLGFKIHPGESWVLETGQEYDILIEVFDKSGNKMYLSDNIRIDCVFPVEHFEILHSSSNGSFHHVKALKEGHTLFDATLRSVVDEMGGVHPLVTRIHNEQDVEIYKPIVLSPSILTFPWQPKVGAYQYTIKATGGSGNFSWSSSNTAVATVTVKGVMTTVSDVGVSVIFAHDLRNPLHFGQMKVYVVEPVAMDFAPCQVEARVGLTLDLPLRIFGLLEEKGMERVMLSDCSHFDLQVDEESPGIFEQVQGRLAPGLGHCSGVRAKALAPGYTTLLVSYIHDNVHLNAKITIAAYVPLTAIDPVSVAVVSLGSSKDMLFEGGPRPWVLEPSKFFCTLKAEDEESVSLTLTSPSSHNYNQHWVRTTCRVLGEQLLDVKVGNKASVTNPYPAVELTSIKFVCAPPSRLTLVPMYEVPLDLSCPLLQQNKQVVPVSNHRNSVLDLAAFDQQGQKFDNFSSLNLVWESTKVSLASIEPIFPMSLHIFEDENKQKKLHGRQTVVVHHQSGIAAVTVTALDYQLSHIKAAKVHSRQDPLTPVSATLELMLVDDVNVFPDTLIIYNHPDVRANLALRDGSGHFFMNTSVKGIADVVFHEAQRTAQIAPIHPGVVEVMVHDLCLAFSSPVKATVHVADILEVNVRVVDKVEIGKSVRCYVRALDDNKRPFPASYFQFMNLKVKAASSIVSLIPVAESTEHDTAVFLVKGVSIGQTSLSAVIVDKTERKISSAPQQIEVFPPFKLIPRKMTLLIGAMMQITSEGGPQPQSNILFSISNEDIASVNGIGHVRGVTIGNVTVTGLVQAVDAETGKLVVVSKDQVHVEVVRLTAIRIRAPITRFKTGEQMPVYVMGLTNSQTPFTFGNAAPGLTFHWSTSKRDILDVQPRHSEANVELSSEHNFGMSVTGRTRGRTGLKVVLKVVDPVVGQLAGNLPELSDEIQIQVYDKLHMLNPKIEAGEILIAPNSVLKLQTNRDGMGALSYRMLDSTDHQLVIAQVDDKGLLSSGSLTGISSLLVTSQESFGVNQTLTIAVKVMPVSYVRFSTSPVLHTNTKESLKALPLGIVLTFTVHFHASTGETLHSSNSHLTFSTNRDDLVQVWSGPGNHTLNVRTVNVGLTLLAVCDSENTAVADYIPLLVEHAIDPTEAQKLVVGDVICFTAHLASQSGGQGTWSSSGNGVLQVDPKTGAAVARDHGTATVYYEIPGVLKTYREVVVEAATKTAALAQASPVRIGKETKVLLTTRFQGNNLIGTCSSIQTEAIAQLQPETSVTCHISFTSDAVDFPASSVFKSYTSFDPNIGFYTCSMTLQPMADQLTRVLSMSMTNLVVKADLEGSAFSGEQVSARLPMEPGLYSDLTELLLSNLHSSAELTVFGPAAALADVEVVSSSPIISVRESEVHSGFTSFSKYTISAVDLKAAGSASITISSASLGQSLIIPVTLIHVTDPSANMQAAATLVNMEGGLPLPDFKNCYQMMLFTLFALLAGTAIVIIVLHTVFSPKQQTYPPSFIQKTPSPIIAPDSPSKNSFNHTIPRADPNSSPRLRLYSLDYMS